MLALTTEMPSFYTFSLNCLGFTVTVTASIVLLWFLDTRSSIQRNLLNRILDLFTKALLMETTRSFLMSIVASFWNEELYELVEAHPMLTTWCLSPRFFTVLLVTVMCFLSTGRLLLYMRPVMFHQSHSTSCTAIIGVVAALTALSDFLYHWTVCSDSLVRSPVALVFRAQMGFEEKLANNYTYSQTNTTAQISPRTSTVKEENSCIFIPTILLLILYSIVLEVTKAVFIFTKEYIKIRKANQILPSTQPSRPGKTAVQRVRETRPNESRQRSGSFQRMQSVHSTVKTYQRRNSWPALVNQRYPIKTKSNQTIRNSATLNLKSVPQTRRMKNPRVIIIQLFARTSSIVTVFGLVALIILAVSFFFTSSSSSVFLQLILSRFVTYLLVALLVSFYKDIFEFLRRKFNLTPS